MDVDRDWLSQTALRIVRSAGWRRVAARAVDSVLMAVPVVGIFIWANDYYHRNSPGAIEDYAVLVYVVAIAASLAWAVIGWTLYEYFTTANTGRTLGKWLFGLKVMRAGGAAIGPWRAFGRAILAMLASLMCIPLAYLFYGLALYIWVAALVVPVLFSRRSFVDLIVESSVVRSPRTRRGRATTTSAPVLES